MGALVLDEQDYPRVHHDGKLEPPGISSPVSRGLMMASGNAFLARDRDIPYELCAHLALQEGPAAHFEYI